MDKFKITKMKHTLKTPYGSIDIEHNELKTLFAITLTQDNRTVSIPLSQTQLDELLSNIIECERKPPTP